MCRARRILVVAFVASTLCADRVVAAAPVLRQIDPVGMARNIAGRIIGGFRRGVTAGPVCERRQGSVRAAVSSIAGAVDTRCAVHIPAPLHQYRLPPPLA